MRFRSLSRESFTFFLEKLKACLSKKLYFLNFYKFPMDALNLGIFLSLVRFISELVPRLTFGFATWF